ncbi:HAD family hydrolase [Aliivibrio fischeri]|uniref:HAD family hydrolase n=1 Tax=Aliivibrio fischeri TaxID=668 RepID=UPI0012DAD826|nr:HAD family hydrolase [Aliivibrio fischeri]MUL10700.1 HAD-IB family hydrolase [Aliivibrio fischeri]MUL13883.1 HAD-IB family hydrolase [Aliivibrio fischeri]
MTHPLYIFDLDETLINGDCAMIWNEFLVDKGIVTTPDFLEEDKRLMALYSRGLMDMEDYLTFAMFPLKDIPTVQVERLIEECVKERILPLLFPEAKILINQLKADNIDMIVISASVSFLVKIVAKHIGIEHAIGIDLKEKEGYYTRHILGVPSYREGKVSRLTEWLNGGDKTYSSLHFYTDSINDLPLCLYADHTYLVNPCEQLAVYSKKKNWPILAWGSQ